MSEILQGWAPRPCWGLHCGHGKGASGMGWRGRNDGAPQDSGTLRTSSQPPFPPGAPEVPGHPAQLAIPLPFLSRCHQPPSPLDLERAGLGDGEHWAFSASLGKWFLHSKAISFVKNGHNHCIQLLGCWEDQMRQGGSHYKLSTDIQKLSLRSLHQHVVLLGGKTGHFPTVPSMGGWVSSPDSECPGCSHGHLPTQELCAEGKWEPVGKQQAVSPQEHALDRGLAHTSSGHSIRGAGGKQRGTGPSSTWSDRVLATGHLAEGEARVPAGMKGKVLIAQSCPTLRDPMDCSPPGSSVHRISQARILECVAMPFSRGSSQPKDRTLVSCTAGRFFTI